MAPVVNLAGRWQIKQSNGFTVDVSMNQDGNALSAFCTHSNGTVRSQKAEGTANGDSMSSLSHGTTALKASTQVG